MGMSLPHEKPLREKLLREKQSPEKAAGRGSRKMTAARIAAVMVLAATLAISAAIFMEEKPEVAAPVSTAGNTTDSTTGNTTPAASVASTPAQAAINARQIEAAQAVAGEIGAKPLTGRITERPDFVSLLEWQVLQGVASRHAEPDRELTRLVNNLRFNKQLELWRSLPATTANTAQRQSLATRLLADIPERVSHQEMGLPEAQRLQLAMLQELLPDPEARRLRAEEEARRIGVVFSIESQAASGKPETDTDAAPAP